MKVAVLFAALGVSRSPYTEPQSSHSKTVRPLHLASFTMCMLVSFFAVVSSTTLQSIKRFFRIEPKSLTNSPPPRLFPASSNYFANFMLPFFETGVHLPILKR